MGNRGKEQSTAKLCLNWAEQFWFVYIIVCRFVIVVFVVDYAHLIHVYAYIRNIHTHTHEQFGIHTPFIFWCVSHVLIMTQDPHQPYKKIWWENSECNNNVYGCFFLLFFFIHLVKRVRKLFACSVHFRLLSMDTHTYTYTYFSAPYWIICSVEEHLLITMNRAKRFNVYEHLCLILPKKKLPNHMH